MQRGNPNSPPPGIKSMLVVALVMASMVAGRSATVERDVGSETQVKCTCYPCGCAQSPPPPPPPKWPVPYCPPPPPAPYLYIVGAPGNLYPFDTANFPSSSCRSYARPTPVFALAALHFCVLCHVGHSIAKIDGVNCLALTTAARSQVKEGRRLDRGGDVIYCELRLEPLASLKVRRTNGERQHSGVPQHPLVLAAPDLSETGRNQEAGESDTARRRRRNTDEQLAVSEGEGGLADASVAAEGVVGAATAAGVGAERIRGRDAGAGRRTGPAVGAVGEEDAEGEAGERRVCRLREEDDDASAPFH
ncbi:hypothetical protein BHM03_00041953 [Ensete ventricosum]|nr:hypothetical protein BHM03_00041953 [Ensete ventricosum]